MESIWIMTVKSWTDSLGIDVAAPKLVFHILVFMVWGALLAFFAANGSARLTPRRLLVCVIALLLFGCTTEFLQIFNPYRTACVVDATYNILGGALGLTVWPALPRTGNRLAKLWRQK
jgi:VanZ family protein